MISEPTDINQSISMNQFHLIEALIFIQDFFVFPESIIIQYFQLVKRACYSNKWKAWHLSEAATRGHRRCSAKKGVLKKFAKFTAMYFCQSLFFNDVGGLRPATLFKKRHWHKSFPVNFMKFLKHLFYRTPLLLICVAAS